MQATMKTILLCTKISVALQYMRRECCNSNTNSQTQKNKSHDLIIERKQSLLKRKPNKENAIMLSFYGTSNRIRERNATLLSPKAVIPSKNQHAKA